MFTFSRTILALEPGFQKQTAPNHQHHSPPSHPMQRPSAPRLELRQAQPLLQAQHHQDRRLCPCVLLRSFQRLGAHHQGLATPGIWRHLRLLRPGVRRPKSLPGAAMGCGGAEVVGGSDMLFGSIGPVRQLDSELWLESRIFLILEVF